MPDYNIKDFSPGFGGKIDSQGNVKNIADTITDEGRVKVDIGANIELGEVDVQIGAVELKDASTEARLKINSDGSINMRLVGGIIDGGTF